MEADRLAVALGMGAPFATGEHVALVVFLDQHIAVRPSALVVHHVEVLGIMQPFPLQGLHVPTGRTRHVVITLVAALKQIVDARGALDRRRAGKVELGVTAKSTAPRFCQLDGVALFAYVDFPAVDLITVHIPCRQLGQVGRRAGGGDVQGAAFELLVVSRVLRESRERLTCHTLPAEQEWL